jgi:hypothetical protein
MATRPCPLPGGAAFFSVVRRACVRRPLRRRLLVHDLQRGVARAFVSCSRRLIRGERGQVNSRHAAEAQAALKRLKEASRNPAPAKRGQHAQVRNIAESVRVRRFLDEVLLDNPAGGEARENAARLCDETAPPRLVSASIHSRYASAVCSPGRRESCSRRSSSCNSTIAARRASLSEGRAKRTRRFRSDVICVSAGISTSNAKPHPSGKSSIRNSASARSPRSASALSRIRNSTRRILPDTVLGNS